MARWVDKFYSVLVWVGFVLYTILVSFVSVAFIFPATLLIGQMGLKRGMDRVASFWAKSLFVICPLWQIAVKGKNHVKAGTTYIIVSNHQSVLDILAALAAIPANFKFLAKKELFFIPFMGWHMALAGYISIDRRNSESGKHAILKAKEWLGRGVSVFFFPEGTRSRDGKIRKFKLGAFQIAKELNISILPIVIYGSGDAVPQKALLLKKNAKIQVSIGKPHDVSSYETAEIACQAIYEDMTARLNVMKGEAAS